MLAASQPICGQPGDAMDRQYQGNLKEEGIRQMVGGIFGTLQNVVFNDGNGIAGAG